MEAYGREEEPEEAERIFLIIRADGEALSARLSDDFESDSY